MAERYHIIIVKVILCLTYIITLTIVTFGGLYISYPSIELMMHDDYDAINLQEELWCPYGGTLQTFSLCCDTNIKNLTFSNIANADLQTLCWPFEKKWNRFKKKNLLNQLKEKYFWFWGQPRECRSQLGCSNEKNNIIKSNKNNGIPSTIQMCNILIVCCLFVHMLCVLLLLK